MLSRPNRVSGIHSSNQDAVHPMIHFDARSRYLQHTQIRLCAWPTWDPVPPLLLTDGCLSRHSVGFRPRAARRITSSCALHLSNTRDMHMYNACAMRTLSTRAMHSSQPLRGATGTLYPYSIMYMKLEAVPLEIWRTRRPPRLATLAASRATHAPSIARSARTVCTMPVTIIPFHNRSCRVSYASTKLSRYVPPKASLITQRHW